MLREQALESAVSLGGNLFAANTNPSPAPRPAAPFVARLVPALTASADVLYHIQYLENGLRVTFHDLRNHNQVELSDRGRTVLIEASTKLVNVCISPESSLFLRVKGAHRARSVPNKRAVLQKSSLEQKQIPHLPVIWGARPRIRGIGGYRKAYVSERELRPVGELLSSV